MWKKDKQIYFFFLVLSSTQSRNDKIDVNMPFKEYYLYVDVILYII